MSTLRRIATNVLQGQGFQSEIAALAAGSGKTHEVIEADAQRCLLEVVATQQPLASRMLDRLFLPTHARAWTIDADTGALQQLLERNRDCALIFLPSHRTYVDPMVLAKVLRAHGFPRNYTLGGNNMSFWPIGAVGRRSGIVFIRRSFKDDEVYKLALREYMTHLVRGGHNLEWYLEGGRSRTGKLRPPRYGLLRYLVEAVQASGTEVLLVPVSMTYEQLAELSLMSAEEAGAGKRREGLAWFARYIRDQQKPLGRAYVRFGEPLALKPAADRGPKGGGRWALEKIAFEVCQRINQVTPVTAPALVTLALLGVRDRALTISEIDELIRPLLDYAERRGLPTAQLGELRQPGGIEPVLERLSSQGVVARFDGGLAPVFSVVKGQHRVAAFYRNSAIHWFIERAFLEMALLNAAPADASGRAYGAWMAAMALRDIFKYEFFFTDKQVFRDHMRMEAELLDPEWETSFLTPQGRRQLLERAPFLVAHRALGAFVEAYFILADRLAALPPDAPLDQERLLDSCNAVGQQYLLQKRLHNPECLSRELFRNALQLAQNRELCGIGGPELAQRRRKFAADLWRAADAVAELTRIDQNTSRNSHG